MIKTTFLFLLFLFSNPAAISQEAKPDLVIKEVVFNIVVYTPPPPKPGEPRQAIVSHPSGQFSLLVGNIGTFSFSEQLSISWRVLDEDTSKVDRSNTTMVNWERNILFPGESFWVRVPAQADFKGGTTVKFSIEQPYREGYLPPYEELSYENNSFEYVFPLD